MDLFNFNKAPLPSTEPKASRPVRRLWAGLGAVLLVGLSASAAQAADIYWNIGLHSPGAMVELANAPRVVYGAAPMVMMPAPVYGAAWVPVYPERREHRRHHRHHHRDWGRGDDHRWDDGPRHGGWDRDDRHRH